MNWKTLSIAAVISAALIGCGTTPTVNSSQSAKTLSFDSSGGESGEGAQWVLTRPLTLVGTFSNTPASMFKTFTVSASAQGYTYDWYDRPGIFVEVCGQNDSGQILGCHQASAYNQDELTVNLNCAPSAGVTNFTVRAMDATIHRPTSRIVLNAVSMDTLLLPSPLPPLDSYPRC
jgi:hypothetical protein